MLFHSFHNFRIVDVASGNALGCIKQKLNLRGYLKSEHEELPIRTNSDWLVMLIVRRRRRYLALYKLEDVRNPSIKTKKPVTKIRVRSI